MREQMQMTTKKETWQNAQHQLFEIFLDHYCGSLRQLTGIWQFKGNYLVLLNNASKLLIWSFQEKNLLRICWISFPIFTTDRSNIKQHSKHNLFDNRICISLNAAWQKNVKLQRLMFHEEWKMQSFTQLIEFHASLDKNHLSSFYKDWNSIF